MIDIKQKQIQEYENKQLIEELSKMPHMVIATAYLHALNYMLYGEDVTEKWVTATQNACALEKAYRNGYYDALQNLDEKSCSSGWVPVGERLPKPGEYVGDVARYYLVQNEYGDMLVARYTHGEYWEQIYQTKPIGDEIVAWMPLPKPYEPQGSEVSDADSN